MPHMVMVKSFPNGVVIRPGPDPNFGKKFFASRMSDRACRYLHPDGVWRITTQVDLNSDEFSAYFDSVEQIEAVLRQFGISKWEENPFWEGEQA